MTRFQDIFLVFGKIGLLSFGGPAAQIALMHKELVEDRAWLSEDEFLRALSFCMLLPGPEAMQLATYSGWKKSGVWGGLIAGLLFVLPGALVIALLALAYAEWGDLPWAAALFIGVKATVVIVVLQALQKVAKKSLKAPQSWLIAGLAFLALFLFNLPFPVVVFVAGIWGALTPIHHEVGPIEKPKNTKTLQTIIIWSILWLMPVAYLVAVNPSFLSQIAVFFSTLAVVTFGGAYAVLAYMTQAVVQDFGWLSTSEMIDALGLAETTPGPLILVTQFVAMLAGYKLAGFGLALLAGILTLWVTFAPCFLWIFAGAPYLEWLSSRPRIAGALSAITSSVVGVILNLSLWFFFHTAFGEVTTRDIGPATVSLPALDSFDPIVFCLTALAAVFLFVLRWPLPGTLAAMALAGLFTLWV